MPPLLTATNLNVAFADLRGVKTNVVDKVSFSVGAEKLAIVGESGSGKSLTAKALMKLLPDNAEMSADRLEFDGLDLDACSETNMQKHIRGGKIAMIFQDPKACFNPVLPIGRQIVEMENLHGSITDKKQACDLLIQALQNVSIPRPEQVLDQYPHEMSGGMAQRLMFAMMTLTRPSLIIADEPTSALDVGLKWDVAKLLGDLVDEIGASLILISHDIPLVREFCDRIIVMYRGRIVETMKVSELDQASHPYTLGLLASDPASYPPGAVLPTIDRDPSWLLSESVPAYV